MHQQENCVMREGAGTPGVAAALGVFQEKRVDSAIKFAALIARKLLKVDVSPEGWEIILFTLKGTDPDTQKRRKNGQLFSLITMSRKCCPASAWFVHRQNTAADQSFDFLFHDRFLFRPPT